MFHFVEYGIYMFRSVSHDSIENFYIRGYLLQVKNWVKELRRMLGNDVSLCIAGNKTDLEKERHVPVADAEA